MVQIENEYGFWGDVSRNPLDAKYMQALISEARTILGDNIILYTTDQGTVSTMTRGLAFIRCSYLVHSGSFKGDSVFTTGDFGPSGIKPQDSFAAQKQFNPKGCSKSSASASSAIKGMSPNMVSEYYSGWLSHWGDPTMVNTSTGEF